MRYDFASVRLPDNYTDTEVGAYLILNRQPKLFKETQETVTHMFHRGNVLQPAASLAAAYVTSGGLSEGLPFSPAAVQAISSLLVRPGDPTEDSMIVPDHQLIVDAITTTRWLNPGPQSSETREATLLLGEDKTHRVMNKIRPAIDNIVEDKSYLYPSSLSGVVSGVRVLTQVCRFLF